MLTYLNSRGYENDKNLACLRRIICVADRKFASSHVFALTLYVIQSRIRAKKKKRLGVNALLDLKMLCFCEKVSYRNRQGADGGSV